MSRKFRLPLSRVAAVLLAPPLLAQPAPVRPPAATDSAESTAAVEAALPAVAREFRGAWVATVANIDWPSRPGLPVADQQRELLAILDRAVVLHLNAIVFQVRPAADALYASKLEPWSYFLTGRQGRAPEPFWDPLAFAVTEAHRRGLELHAWFNPFRAHVPGDTSPPAKSHVTRRHPRLVRPYGPYLWLDPGEPAVQEMALRVIRDVVRRYDVDGVQIDDYFYPYREPGPRGGDLPFPDDRTWRRYRRSGGRLSRDDWRRQNVNRFVKRLHAAVHEVKPTVKVGVSPFGIWRPGSPSGVAGLDSYQEIYTDSRLWLRNGWVDYWAPQLYWRADAPQQRYTALLGWWDEQNVKGRHLWPGLFTSRVAGTEPRNVWDAGEILGEIRLTREQGRSSGNVHFSMQALMENRDGLGDSLATSLYAEPALVPASPWLDAKAPARPTAVLRRDSTSGNWVVRATPGGRERPWLWVVRYQADSTWRTIVVPAASAGSPASRTVDLAIPQSLPALIAVAAADRTGNLSPSAIVRPPAVLIQPPPAPAAP